MIQSFITSETISIKDADSILKTLNPKILFLTNGKKLQASLSDGDILRYLMKHNTPDSPAINAANRIPYFETSINAARMYLSQHSNLKAIPIVNNRLEIQDIVFAKVDINQKLCMPVVINAGGKGTRLDPYTRILPKALIPVGDTPIIERIMRQFQDWGCDEFHIIINHKKELIKAYFSENEHVYHIIWHEEMMPLGTAGGLSLLKDAFEGTLFFTNCDILVQTDYRCLVKKHQENKNDISIVSALKSMSVPYGVIETDDKGEVVRFREKPEYSFLTNTGLYLLEPNVIDRIKTGISQDFPDLLADEMEISSKVGVLPIRENEWLDMGQLDKLERMRTQLEQMEEI